MGYLWISIAATLFSIQFVFTRLFQKIAGTRLQDTLVSNALSPILFVLIFFMINKMQLHCTPYSLVLALIWGAMGIACTYFAIKVLAWGSLTNYALWLLGGGMLLPLAYVVLFNHDVLSVWAIIGCVLILAALFVKVDYKEKNKKILLGSLVLFILNGLMAVVYSIYQGDLFTYEKVGDIDFSILCSLSGMMFAILLFPIVYLLNKKKKVDEKIEVKPTEKPWKRYLKASPWALMTGLCNGMGNYLLLIALTTIIPSVQFPMLTGGSIFLSALFGLFFKEKQTKRGWVAVALAIVGTVLFVF